ncbi:MAG: cytochrome b/b6 domain-containing protein [Oceanicoccus sp.]
MPKTNNMIKVWDPLIRLFHWSLVLFFFVAYLVEIDRPLLHSYSGYAISLLLLFRLVWGCIGSQYARFSSFLTGPGVAWSYLKAIINGDAPRYIGHNPAGALMIVALIIGLLITVLSGMSLVAMEGSGPLANTFAAALPARVVEPVHEFSSDVMVVMIVLHVAGALATSKIHRENLLLGMVTGSKKRDRDK